MEITIEARLDGFIVDLRRDGEPLMCREDGETADALTFDEATNRALLTPLVADPRRFRLSGGVLYLDGAEQQIALPGPAYIDRREALQLARGLKAYNNLDSPTLAQSVAAIKANNRITLVLARLLLRELESE